MVKIELLPTIASRLLGELVGGSSIRFHWTSAGLSAQGGAGREGHISWDRVHDAPTGWMDDREAIAIASMAVFVAASLSSLPPAAHVKVQSECMFQRAQDFRSQQMLSFHRLGDDWMTSVAVGPYQEEIEQFALEESERVGRGATATASRLQSLGVAALAANQSPKSSRCCERSASQRSQTEHGNSSDGPLILNGAVSELGRYRVLCLGRVVAAPWASELLEAVGVEVLRVRPPGYSGKLRKVHTIDLGTTEGSEELISRVQCSDLVLENFRPRGWDQAVPLQVRRQVRRHVAIRGFPSSSPCRNWKVFGSMVEALFGLIGPPGQCGIDCEGDITSAPLWDRVTGTLAAAVALQLLGEPPGGSREVSLVGAAHLFLNKRKGSIGES